MNLFSLRRHSPSLDDLLTDSSFPPKDDNLCSEYLMPRVDRPNQVFVRGQGSWLWDSDDRAYLDFSQGCAANTHPVNPAVLVETVVLGCQNGRFHHIGDFVKTQHIAAFFTKFANQHLIRRVNAQRHSGAVVDHGAEIGQVGPGQSQRK